jgi:Flp pilus assembly pilin Flp
MIAKEPLRLLLERLQWQQETGQDLTEYALLIALIALVAICGVMLLGYRLYLAFWSGAHSF